MPFTIFISPYLTLRRYFGVVMGRRICKCECFPPEWEMGFMIGDV